MTTNAEGRDDAVEAGDPSSPARTGRRPADTFAVRLILVRHLNGLTIGEAARLAGLNDATWSTWEAGRRPRDILDVCHRIAAAHDIDEHWLLFGGPLAGPRYMSTKRPGEDTLRYSPMPARPTDNRPNGRPGTGRDRTSTGLAPRRPVRISGPTGPASRPQAA